MELRNLPGYYCDTDERIDYHGNVKALHPLYVCIFASLLSPNRSPGRFSFAGFPPLHPLTDKLTDKVGFPSLARNGMSTNRSLRPVSRSENSSACSEKICRPFLGQKDFCEENNPLLCGKFQRFLGKRTNRALTMPFKMKRVKTPRKGGRGACPRGRQPFQAHVLLKTGANSA
jgi:hypothetical protein